MIFTDLADSLGPFSHRVAMSVCLSGCLRHLVKFFLGLSLALRSYDHFQASHKSVMFCTFFSYLFSWTVGPMELLKSGSSELIYV